MSEIFRQIINSAGLAWMFVDWDAVGRATLAQLPKREHTHFITWLENNDAALAIYEKSPGQALAQWNDSTERYQAIGMQLPEGF